MLNRRQRQMCIRDSSRESLELESRPRRVLTPVNGAHKAVLMALERGKLQDLLFDNRALWSHRAMAAVLGAILKLPPVKRALVSKQIQSRYVETLLEQYGN